MSEHQGLIDRDKLLVRRHSIALPMIAKRLEVVEKSIECIMSLLGKMAEQIDKNTVAIRELRESKDA